MNKRVFVELFIYQPLATLNQSDLFKCCNLNQLTNIQKYSEQKKLY